MTKTLIIFFGVLLYQYCYCQKDTSLCLFPDTEAVFEYKNCDQTVDCVKQFVVQNLLWPSQETVILTVYIECTVEKDGSLSQLKVIKGGNINFNEASLNIVRKMPKWIPAKKDGVEVRTKIQIPVRWE